MTLSGGRSCKTNVIPIHCLQFKSNTLTKALVILVTVSIGNMARSFQRLMRVLSCFVLSIPLTEPSSVRDQVKSR